jgi:hypothetical protein
MAYSQINSGTAIGPSFAAGSDSFFEKARLNMLAAMFGAFSAGGSRSVAVAGVGYQDAENYLDFGVPDTASSGGVWKAYVDLKGSAGVDITPRIYNVTDASTAVVGTAEASTTWAEQVLTFVPVVGKRYRLQFVKADDSGPAWGIGFIQRTEG